ncbi:MAG: hypothetical protein HQL51_02975 [Magnetococcales bacterium]|nr:hypothetical protein [Magnetococcales bacterium]
MTALNLEMAENGYEIQEQQTGRVMFQGIRSWDAAWEVHEMLTGELEEEEELARECPQAEAVFHSHAVGRA